MALNIQLKDFTAKPAPVPADIVYIGNSADSYNEVQSTIAEIIAAYPALSSIGGLTTVAGEYIYTTAADTYATALITATPTASQLAAWDANKNLFGNNVIPGSQTVVTAAGNTVLTAASPYLLFLTGSTTQTVTMPVVSTLAIGFPQKVINLSTGVITINSSGGNLITTLPAGAQAVLTCSLITGTSAASWNASSNAAYVASSITLNGGSPLKTYIAQAAFTPTITFATPGDLSVAYTIQTGFTVQMGDLVFVYFFIQYTPTFTTASGQLRIAGFPISMDQGYYCLPLAIIQPPTFPAGTTMMVAASTAGASYATVVGYGSAVAAANLSASNHVTGTAYYIGASGFYVNNTF